MMFAFPCRVNQRVPRTVPTAFDPSGNPLCSGWWRADRGITAAPATRAITQWASIIPPYLPFTIQTSPSFLLAQNFTNGWPAVVAMPGCANYLVAGFAQAGDRDSTLTYVVRFPHALNGANGGTHIYLSGQELQAGIWDGYLRTWMAGGWRNWWDGWYYPCGVRAVTVVTYRLQDRGDGSRNVTLFYNGTSSSTAGMTGQAAFGPGSQIRISAEPRRPIFFHEIIYVREAMSDAAIVAMHQALLRQYGSTP